MELKPWNKKGIIFTFLAVLIAGLLSAMYSTHQITPLDADISIERARIIAANQRYINVVSYIETTLSISGYRVLQEMIDYIHEEDTFYTESELSKIFNEIIINGSINGVSRSNMENFTVNILMDKIVDLVKNETSAIIIYNLTSVQIDQIKPFAVTAYLNMTLVFRDKNTAWNSTKIIISDISIEGLKDPLYFDMEYNSTFKKTYFKIYKFNTTTFELFVNRSEYIVSPNIISINRIGTFKPISFFGRMTNNPEFKNESTLTLLSIVNPQKLTVAPPNASYIDYMFATTFNKTNCLQFLKVVNETTNQPYIDAEHLSLIFNITDNQVDAIC